MATFKFGRYIDIHWNGYDIQGPANTIFSIPDQLYEEFDADIAPVEPTLQWIDTNEFQTLSASVSAATLSANAPITIANTSTGRIISFSSFTAPSGYLLSADGAGGAIWNPASTSGLTSVVGISPISSVVSGGVVSVSLAANYQTAGTYASSVSATSPISATLSTAGVLSLSIDPTLTTAASATKTRSLVRNSTVSTIAKGSFVYIDGSNGTVPTIQKALANADVTSARTFGIVEADITSNSDGYVTNQGLITGIDTSAFADGDVLWLSPTIAGAATTTKPAGPDHGVLLGIVVKGGSVGNGSIYIFIKNGVELDEVHDVNISGVANGQALIYSSTASVWQNKVLPVASVSGTSPVSASTNTTTGAVSLSITAGSINSTHLSTGAVASSNIAAGAVGSAALADSAVVSAKIAANAVTSGHIATGAVGSAQIAANAVVLGDIAAGAVDSSALANNAVVAAKIAAAAVGSAAIAASAVGSAAIAAGAVNTSAINSGSATSGQALTANGSGGVSFTTITSAPGAYFIHSDAFSVLGSSITAPAGAYTLINYGDASAKLVTSGTTTTTLDMTNGKYLSSLSSLTSVTRIPPTTDLSTWNTVSTGVTQTGKAVTYGSGTALIGFQNSSAATSIDGASWTVRNPGFAGSNINAATFGNNLYVVGGDSGKLSTSTDAISWTSRTSQFSTTIIRGLTYGNNLYVAVGDAAKLSTSIDGASWTSRTSGFSTTNINAITFGNGVYVIVGEQSKIATSTDGSSWTIRTSASTSWLNGVTYGNGTYVAVGNSGTIMTSTDGTTWTLRTSGTTVHLLSASYANGVFVVGGNSGTIRVSIDDGVTWSSRTNGFGASGPVNALGYAGSYYIATGTTTTGLTQTSSFLTPIDILLVGSQLQSL